MSFPHSDKCTVAVIGLGYVGLPLAIELSKNKNNCILNNQLERKVIGFDINQNSFAGSTVANFLTQNTITGLTKEIDKILSPFICSIDSILDFLISLRTF